MVYVYYWDEKILYEWNLIFSRQCYQGFCFITLIYESRGGTSDFRLPTSDFRLPTSDFRLPTSDFRLPTSDFRLPTSDFRLQTSDFRLQTSDFRLQTSDFGLQTSDFRLQTSDFRFPTSKFKASILDDWDVHKTWTGVHGPPLISKRKSPLLILNENLPENSGNENQTRIYCIRPWGFVS